MEKDSNISVNQPNRNQGVQTITKASFSDNPSPRQASVEDRETKWSWGVSENRGSCPCHWLPEVKSLFHCAKTNISQYALGCLYLLFKLLKYFYISWKTAFAQARCKASLAAFLEQPGSPCDPSIKAYRLPLLIIVAVERFLGKHLECHTDSGLVISYLWNAKID